MTGRQRNLEVKASDPDPGATLAAAVALGARDEGLLRQRDTSFHAVQGRLKLREAPPRPAELISYARAELARPKVSLYRVVTVADQLRAALWIADERLVPVGYADLLTRRGRLA